MACSGCKKPTKKLTVGMAVYDDFRAAALTIQSLRLHGGLSHDELDVLVVDNHHSSADGKCLREFCRGAGVRYVTCQTVGTSAPRNTIFSHAQGEVVCVIDSHVLLSPEALARLVKFAEQHPDSQDLWHGALWYDPLKPDEVIPSMRPEWGPDLMYGRWAEPASLPIDAERLEIPMHGLGLFACRKSAWLRFPAGLRGFGAEEGNLHELFRRHGRQVFCLPFLRWWHLFHRQGEPTKYPNTYEDRCRNYLIWALSLALPTTDICQRFAAKLGKETVSLLLDEAEKIHAPAKERKGFLRKAWNYAQAVAAHRLAGSPGVTEAEYRGRLDACDGCDRRVENECVECGCQIEEKAAWRVETCPHKNGPRWPVLLPLAAAAPALPAAPLAATSLPATKTPRPQRDPSSCPHTQFVSAVRIERGDTTTATLSVKCRDCGQQFAPPGDSAARFTLAPLTPDS